jgi:protein tyrosine/serine phosphatase
LVAAAFSALANATPGAVLIHCGAGRDRTGMIVAMLLALVDVGRAAILDDYVTGVREHNVRLQRGDLSERARTDAELESAIQARATARRLTQPTPVVQVFWRFAARLIGRIALDWRSTCTTGVRKD